jgi:regulator of protease activity HflC (stomatin/prohibitin superfamily)
MAENTTGPQTKPESAKSTASLGRLIEGLFKAGVVVLATFIVLSILFVAGRAAVYKIHEYERGLHLRGVEQPGWHVQIPLVDTVIIVTVSERLGYVEQIAAMTSDDVTMNVSLQYTYRVTNPERFALDVADPERIVFEFVQGKLRDVVNTKPMTEVMHSRAALNQEVMGALQGKEEQYGVSFVTVQIQSASPPPEVVTAIKDRMVAVQRQEQAQAEAAQRKTLADADFYVAQKEADANAYRLTQVAQAEAQGIALSAEAQQQAARALLAEMRGEGALAEKYLDYLIAQELKENSKWVIGGGESLSILDLGGE